MAALLFDTDVLVDYLRAHIEAISFLEACAETMLVPAVVVAELYAGVREGKERIALGGFLAAFEIVSIDAAIAERGGLLRRDFGKSHGTGLSDALIAATAQQRGATLVSLNRKHYPMLSDVLVPYVKNAH